MVNANTSYNILLGRSPINCLKAIVFTPHLAMKFPSAAGDIVTVQEHQKTACDCYVASLKVNQPVCFTRHQRADGPLEEEDVDQDLEGQPEINLEKEILQKENIWLLLSTLTFGSTKPALNPARTFARCPSVMKNIQHIWEHPWNSMTSSW